jgi:transcriptional regulator with XRE-family HTH domain
VARFKRSGLSQREFAERAGVSVVTLRSWIARFRREDAEASPLLPVRVVASTAPKARSSEDTAGAVEIEVASGVRLRFAAGTDVAYVAALVATLR